MASGILSPLNPKLSHTDTVLIIFQTVRWYGGTRGARVGHGWGNSGTACSSNMNLLTTTIDSSDKTDSDLQDYDLPTYLLLLKFKDFLFLIFKFHFKVYLKPLKLHYLLSNIFVPYQTFHCS